MNFEKFSSGRVAVIGDLMLDVYLWGQVSRISPEAPVPIVSLKRSEYRPGGAANVMRNLGTLKAASIYAFGAVGDDASGRQLLAELEKQNISGAGIVSDKARPTTEKRRIMAGAQQLLREDIEDTRPVDDSLRRQMVNKLIDLVRSHAVDGVIFEDYAKGVLAPWMLEEVLLETRKAGIPAVLDPKPGSLTPVKHLTAIKPNRSEAFAMAGIADPGAIGLPEQDEALAQAARILMEQWEPENLLLSLAAQGLGVFREDHWATLIPTRAREVYDVSGAGDTVTATFMLALTAGCKVEEAAEIANCAAGVVVGKIGTAPILYDELTEAWKELKK